MSLYESLGQFKHNLNLNSLRLLCEIKAVKRNLKLFLILVFQSSYNSHYEVTQN